MADWQPPKAISYYGSESIEFQLLPGIQWKREKGLFGVLALAIKHIHSAHGTKSLTINHPPLSS